MFQTVTSFSFGILGCQLKMLEKQRAVFLLTVSFYEPDAIWIICKNIFFISAYEQDLSVKPSPKYASAYLEAYLHNTENNSLIHLKSRNNCAVSFLITALWRPRWQQAGA